MSDFRMPDFLMTGSRETDGNRPIVLYVPPGLGSLNVRIDDRGQDGLHLMLGGSDQSAAVILSSVEDRQVTPVPRSKWRSPMTIGLVAVAGLFTGLMLKPSSSAHMASVPPAVAAPGTVPMTGQILPEQQARQAFEERLRQPPRVTPPPGPRSADHSGPASFGLE